MKLKKSKPEVIRQELLDMNLSGVTDAILDFKRDNAKFSLFEIDLDKDGNVSDFDFNSALTRFFILLCGSNNLVAIDMGSPLLTFDEYQAFICTYISDVKMALLKDAVVKLATYCESNPGKTEIQNELLYTADEFRCKIKDYISNYVNETELGDSGALNGLVDHFYYGFIHLKVPKICFPWYAHALCQTYGQTSDPDLSQDLNIINLRKLNLQYSKNKNKYQQRTMAPAQRHFKAFIRSLRTEEDYNRSLSLSLFNDSTKLYDVYELWRWFEITKLYYVGDNAYRARNKAERKTIAGPAQVATIDTWGVKTLLLHKYNNRQLFLDKRVWGIYKEILKYTKQHLLLQIKEHETYKHSKIPKAIRLHYCVYSLWKKQEPYEELLRKISTIELPTYEQVKGKSHAEKYAHAYRSVYSVARRGKKEKRKRINAPGSSCGQVGALNYRDFPMI